MWGRKTGIGNKNGCGKREALGNGAMKAPLKFHPLSLTKGFISLGSLTRVLFYKMGPLRYLTSTKINLC